MASNERAPPPPRAFMAVPVLLMLGCTLLSVGFQEPDTCPGFWSVLGWSVGDGSCNLD